MSCINDFLIKFQNTQPVKGQQCVNHALFIPVLSMHVGNVIITYEKNAISLLPGVKYLGYLPICTYLLMLNKWVEEKAEVLYSSKGQHSPHDPISMWTLVVTNSPLIISRVTVFFEVARANMLFRIIYK